MIFSEKSTPLDGMTLKGAIVPFQPLDSDSAVAVFERNGQRCGITYETGISNHYLRVAPNYQLPVGARNKSHWNRFIWECDDDRAMRMTIDPDDGEIRYIYDETPLESLDDIQKSIDATLGFVLGKQFHDELVAYVNHELCLC